MFDLAKLLRAGKLRLRMDQVLIDELGGVRYEIRSDGRVATAKRKGQSPDRAEALALAVREAPQPMVVSLAPAHDPWGGYAAGRTRAAREAPVKDPGEGYPRERGKLVPERSTLTPDRDKREGR